MVIKNWLISMKYNYNVVYIVLLDEKINPNISTTNIYF